MNKWIKAARLRTLPLSLSGIILGVFSTISSENLTSKNIGIALLCFLTTLLFQVLSNYANDYGDAEKGTDNSDRVGPKRAIQSGSITSAQMKKAIITTTLLSITSAISLIYISFGQEDFLYSILFFVLALFSIGAAIKYTMGTQAYGYRGLGDVFVFIFFGLVSTLGSSFLFNHQFQPILILPSTAIGLLSVAVLNMNNMRDIENDAQMGKQTIVVKMGFKNAKKYHYSLIITSIICFLTFTLLQQWNAYFYLYTLTFIPLIKNLKTVQKTTIPKQLDSELKRLALTTFFISLTLSIILFIK